MDSFSNMLDISVGDFVEMLKDITAADIREFEVRQLVMSSSIVNLCFFKDYGDALFMCWLEFDKSVSDTTEPLDLSLRTVKMESVEPPPAPAQVKDADWPGLIVQIECSPKPPAIRLKRVQIPYDDLPPQIQLRHARPRKPTFRHINVRRGGIVKM